MKRIFRTNRPTRVILTQDIPKLLLNLTDKIQELEARVNDLEERLEELRDPELAAQRRRIENLR